MSFRFRRSVRLFPGVRLNFSGSGISTTVGVRGAGVTFGRTGTHLNVGLPGTGLSYRTRIDSPATAMPKPSRQPTSVSQHNEPLAVSEYFSAQPLASADVSELTSAGLAEVKRLINEAATMRCGIRVEVAAMTRVLQQARGRLKFAQTFIIRIFTAGSIEGLAQNVDDADERLADAQAREAACTIEVDFALSDEALASYTALVRSFEAMASSHRLWDVTAKANANQFAERTIADQNVARELVSFGIDDPVIVKSAHRTMRLGNVGGRDIWLFPAFLMMRDPAGDFGLIEYGAIDLACQPRAFIEEEGVPPDTETIGQTWKRANKDGSPDRRFADNYAIPIVRYGELRLSSGSGLHEAYQVSNFAATDAFAATFARHRLSLNEFDSTAELTKEARRDLHDDDAAKISDAFIEHRGERASLRKPNLAPDWLTLAAVACLIAWLATVGLPAGPSPLIPAAAQPSLQPVATVPDDSGGAAKAVRARARPTASSVPAARAKRRVTREQAAQQLEVPTNPSALTVIDRPAIVVLGQDSER